MLESQYENNKFITRLKPAKLGIMVVGLGGNNGTTFVAGLLANKKKLSWNTKDGKVCSNWLGSITQSSYIQNKKFNEILPMVNPDDIIVTGWDLSFTNLYLAMRRAKVLDFALQEQLKEKMEKINPLPGIYIPEYIAENQEKRVDNFIPGTNEEKLEKVRNHIKEFKKNNNLETVIVVWSASTEKFCEVVEGINDTAENLLHSLNSRYISPSSLYCIASILEGCHFINGSPQNTITPGIQDLANCNGVLVIGDDFKTGQTKMKTVLTDFLVSAGMKPLSIVSYNHLGNNDGENLSSYEQFRSKEISKSSVIDDIIKSNPDFSPPDHVIVIKYVPSVGDSKRAMDEYYSEIFMGGRSNIAIHNICEDSLLAVPIMVDLCILLELFTRITINGKKITQPSKLLGYFIKSPLSVNSNSLFKQRLYLENFLLVVSGKKPETFLDFDF